MKYKTRLGSSPREKQRVLVISESYGEEFDYYTKKILQTDNCCIWYQETNDIVQDELLEEIMQMQLAVILVTEELLQQNGSYISSMLFMLEESKIPVLPILTEKINLKLYETIFGRRQYLSPYEIDETTKSFDEKLSEYLSSILISDEMNIIVRDAFCAYVFVSYRKIDRAVTLTMLEKLHEDDYLRDIAIWYDEFLKPGEDFEEAIKEAIRHCNLFLIASTGNTIDTPNYVIDDEIPFANDRNCKIIPIELDEGHSEQFRTAFGREVYTLEQLSDVIREKLGKLLETHKDDSPMHLFCIGLAFLNGISVEKNTSKGIRLIHEAAEKELPEAIKKMSEIFRYGQGIIRNSEKALEWQKKLVLLYDRQYSAGNADKAVYYNLLEALLEAGKLSQETEDFSSAEEYFNRAIMMVNNETEQSKTPLIGLFSLMQLEQLGKTTYYLAYAKEESQPVMSINLYLSAIEYYKESCWGNYERGIASCEMRLGFMHMNNGDYEQSIHYFNKANEFYAAVEEKTVDDVYQTATSEHMLAEAEFHIGDDLNKIEIRINKAIELLSKLYDETNDRDCLVPWFKSVLFLATVLLQQEKEREAYMRYLELIDIAHRLDEQFDYAGERNSQQEIDVRWSKSTAYYYSAIVCGIYGDEEGAYDFLVNAWTELNRLHELCPDMCSNRLKEVEELLDTLEAK